MLKNTIGLIQCLMGVTQFDGMLPILILATEIMVILSLLFKLYMCAKETFQHSVDNCDLVGIYADIIKASSNIQLTKYEEVYP